MKKEKKFKAWAVMKFKAWIITPSFLSNKELKRYSFFVKDNRFMIYLTKKAAEKDNDKMDEIVVPCEVIILK